MHEFSLTQRLLNLVLKNVDSKQMARGDLWTSAFSDEPQKAYKFCYGERIQLRSGEDVRFERIEVR